VSSFEGLVEELQIIAVIPSSFNPFGHRCNNLTMKVSILRELYWKPVPKFINRYWGSSRTGSWDYFGLVKRK